MYEMDLVVERKGPVTRGFPAQRKDTPSGS